MNNIPSIPEKCQRGKISKFVFWITFVTDFKTQQRHKNSRKIPLIFYSWMDCLNIRKQNLATYKDKS